MRLDKFLCEAGVGTRSEVKNIIKKRSITVNGVVTLAADQKINELTDIICYNGQRLSYQKFVYYMMNKPQGVVSATRDDHDKTVLDLLKPEDKKKDLFPAGRLDKDTEGFLLLTNDGDLAHRLLAPRKHVDKIYEVTIMAPLSAEDISRLENGVNIGEKDLTAPAKVTVISDQVIHLTIHEGKFHQVKRMLEAVGNKVIGLKRIQFGGIDLDTFLLPGEYRVLTDIELETLHEA